MGTRVDNEATGERENKQTLMVREQYMDVDDKAAPGRQRYRHGSRMHSWVIRCTLCIGEPAYWGPSAYQLTHTLDGQALGPGVHCVLRIAY